MMKDKILMIGAAIVDVLVAPAKPSVFDTGSFGADTIQMSFGGDAMNEATVLASLGKQVYLNTVIGDDPQGEMIRNRCEKLGIHMTSECVKKEFSTGINVVLVQENGERSFLTNRNGSLRKLSAQDIAFPFPEETGILCYASIFVSPQMKHDALANVLSAEEETKVYTSGTTNILKYPELNANGKASQLLYTFEEKKQLSEIINDRFSEEENRGIQVYIGDETSVDSMRDCSVVTATYEIEEGVYGKVGILGPKRMDYERVVETLQNLMVSLDEIFKKDGY